MIDFLGALVLFLVVVLFGFILFCLFVFWNPLKK